ncbi:MAG: elongation factor P-like protein YeiP [Gammaproteobacteria bacterium]|nr:MAG: elongation factor P-like protein YeiP [Gammaproteobacteria bacterium]
MKASELKKGLVLDIDGRMVIIKHLEVQSPSSRSGSTLYKVRGHDILTRQKIEARYKGDENVQTLEFGRRPVQFLYRDADGCTFMDRESYEQYTLPAEALEEELKYLSENLDGILAIIADDTVLGIELPATVSLEILDTAPGMKTASSSARTKPATLSTGLVIQVPEYLSPGETVKVNTGTGEYVSRA